MTEPTDKELEAFAIEEQFLLFCDVDEFTQIAREVLAKWGTPTTAGAVPLTDGQIRAMAREHPAEDLCGWSYLMGVVDAERHHGIKGGQHGAE